MNTFINKITFFIGYIKHFISSGNEHDVHSPFVFKFLTEAVYNKKKDPAFDKIEKIRNQLLSDDREISVVDLGAGSSFDGTAGKRKISSITKNFAKSPDYCRLLFRLTEFLQPATMIELGTSVGISAMYQSAGNPKAIFYTLEGCPGTSKIARENFRKNGFENVVCITGNFNETLPQVLMKTGSADYIFIDGNHTYDGTIRYFNLIKKYAHNNTVIIFDDINWSDGMKNVWEEIKKDTGITITLDFFVLGIVFFNKDFTKQDFRIRRC